MRDRERAVEDAHHLRKAARLEARRHEDEVRAGVGEPRERLVEVGDGHAPVDVVEVDDVVEDALVVAVGDEDDLQLPIPVLRDGAVEDLGEELASLLDGIEARGPEEDGRGVVHLERETLLEFSLGGAASDDVRGGIVAHRKSVVDGRIVVGVRRVENAQQPARTAAHLQRIWATSCMPSRSRAGRWGSRC